MSDEHLSDFYDGPRDLNHEIRERALVEAAAPSGHSPAPADVIEQLRPSVGGGE